MEAQRPQYHQNNLPLPNIDKETLQRTLRELQSAIRHGIDLIQNGVPPPENPAEYGSFFSGTPGVALAFARLQHQAPSLTAEGDPPLPDFRTLAHERVLRTGPSSRLDQERFSPLCTSKLGAVYLRALDKCVISNRGRRGARTKAKDVGDIARIVQLASRNPYPVIYGPQPKEEVLYGRAGLLWAIENLRDHAFDYDTQRNLRPVFNSTGLMVDTIIDAGQEGAQSFVKKHGEKDALPLMWLWIDGYYGLGAMHGACGILTILLQCQPDEIKDGELGDRYPMIADTITGLCKICISNNGHLPMSIPPRPSESQRPSPFVQICHGVPGLLLLLATAKSIILPYSKPEWDEAIRLGTERVWEEGLLSKGGGLCHGIAGNAWPLLLLHANFEYIEGQQANGEGTISDRKEEDTGGAKERLSGDYFLSRALAFLLHARNTRPYNDGAGAESDFRMPDRPYSLFEGLSGTVCAWAEACALLQCRLRRMELEEKAGHPLSTDDLAGDDLFRDHVIRPLGFPGLGGKGPNGLL